LVNIKHEGNTLQESMLLHRGPIWCTQSIVLTVTGSSAITTDILQELTRRWDSERELLRRQCTGWPS